MYNFVVVEVHNNINIEDLVALVAASDVLVVGLGVVAYVILDCEKFVEEEGLNFSFGFGYPFHG